MFSKNGSLLLFRFLGVSVYVHWTWAIAAIWRIQSNMKQAGNTHGIPYHTAWLLVLFAIVLVHEFGHSLACKSVGGKADTIILQPLGGVAYVQPPERPGPMLWSIAAGPLVNVILLPLTIIPAMLMRYYGTGDPVTDFVVDIAKMNAVLLAFNMLPFYPLDGGQILRSILWFMFGRGISLIIAGYIGIVGAAGLALLVLFATGGDSLLIAVLIGFMGLQCLQAIRIGNTIRRMEQAPSRAEARCPSCGKNPPIGVFWSCPCGMKLDTFDTAAHCPKCGRVFSATACPLCNVSSPLNQWYAGQSPGPQGVLYTFRGDGTA